MDSHGFVKVVILLSSLISLLNRAFASNHCDFPAIFNFGDSNSDTGGLSAAFGSLPPPYGETFFRMPAGRYSDGRLIIDFIAESFGLPYLSAYLDSVGSNFSHGANFATGGSTIRPLISNVLPLGVFSPFSFDLQYTQFTQLKFGSQLINKQGGIFTELLPKDEYFSRALYTIDIGANDLAAGFLGNMSIQEVNTSIPDIVNKFSLGVKSLYNQGGRSFWIHNMGPLGCMPYFLVSLPIPAAQIDWAGCGIPYNDVARYFNQRLKEAVVRLRENLPLAAITYIDIYSAKYSLISQAKKYGFEHPLIACCGYGGKYNYSADVGCGGTISINGTQVLVGACKRPSVRVNWDGIHYTEAANKWIFDQIKGGKFSDPPIPLKLACHK